MRCLWLLALVVALTGCGGSVEVSTKPDRLDGSTIASRANAQLEKENPSMVPGDLTCADVEYEVGATSRCVRTVVLDDGRLVRIGATVTIDRTTGGGHFKVKIDEKAEEFGLTGKAVLAELVKQYARRYGGKAPTGSCPPYLAGKVGTTMTCTLDTSNGRLSVQVKVTNVDPETYTTGYTFRAEG
jgi:hypothetical protein